MYIYNQNYNYILYITYIKYFTKYNFMCWKYFAVLTIDIFSVKTEVDAISCYSTHIPFPITAISNQLLDRIVSACTCSSATSLITFTLTITQLLLRSRQRHQFSDWFRSRKRGKCKSFPWMAFKHGVCIVTNTEYYDISIDVIGSTGIQISPFKISQSATILDFLLRPLHPPICIYPTRIRTLLQLLVMICRT